tara:strand:- start:3504 stop:4502 length:999 start_codon:yes stop_codon:yes gene_type:complete
MRTIRPSLLAAEIKANALAGLATMIWGAPGEGKSEIVYDVAKQMDAKLFEVRANLFDPVDVRGGLKVVEQTDGTYRTKYGVPEDYPDSNYQGVVIIFIDELSTAPKATQNSFLQLLTTGKIGTYQAPPNTIFIAAGNRAIDRAAVHEMPTPVKNRFSHFTLEANIDDWVAWAVNANIDPSIVSFLRYRPQLLSDVDASQNAFPTPRAWEYVSRKLPFMADEFYGVSSLVGDGAAGEYIAFKQIYTEVPDIDDILAKPTTTKVPTGTSVLYAVCGALTGRVDATNFEAVMKYTKRMPPEYQVIVVRDSLAKDRSLLQSEPFTKWTQENADVLL